jgi:hypothetical protein
MDFKKMIFDVMKVALGFAVGLAVYNKFLGGSPMASVESDESAPESTPEEE